MEFLLQVTKTGYVNICADSIEEAEQRWENALCGQFDITYDDNKPEYTGELEIMN